MNLENWNNLLSYRLVILFKDSTPDDRDDRPSSGSGHAI